MNCTQKSFEIPLSNGVLMPKVGLGTFPYQGQEIHSLIEHAYELGYRSFDSAWLYNNEIDI